MLPVRACPTRQPVGVNDEAAGHEYLRASEREGGRGESDVVIFQIDGGREAFPS
jgi:hypothetical protein